MTGWMLVAALLNAALGCYLFYHVLSWLKASGKQQPLAHPQPTVSVIIPARNESQTLSRCLAALARQTYPAHLWQVIVINDRSTDGTQLTAASWVDQFKAAGGPDLQVVTLSGPPGPAPKKEALTAGIELARGEIILTTDADCVAQPTWVACMAAHFHTATVAVVGPLSKHHSAGRGLGTPLTWLQALEAAGFTLLALGGAASHMPGMANGANLGFRKKAFTAVGGYAEIDHVASGDDELLLHKLFKKYPQGISAALSRQALVTAYPETQLKSLWQQRVRWVSKGRAYQHPAFQAARVLAYLATAALAPALWYAWASANSLSGTLALSSVGFRLVAEWAVLVPAVRLTRQAALLLLLPWVQPLHWAYLLVIGPVGTLWPRYSWKGRQLQ